MTKVFLFPGQGSQHKGMGAGLFDKFPEVTAEATDVLGYDVAELCLDDPAGQLDQTSFTQPALYTVNALMYLARQQSGVTPAAVAGHSLGEYSALFAAGVFDFATGLRIVQRRGALMAQQTGGAMAAILGLSVAQVEEVITGSGFPIDIANHNGAMQTVVSGRREDVERSLPAFEAAGAPSAVLLKVSGAFHSRLMKTPAEEFAAFLEGLAFRAPGIPVYSNVTALPHVATEIKDALARQIHSRVRWHELVQALMTLPDPQFEEVGPGNVLSGLLRRMKRKT